MADQAEVAREQVYQALQEALGYLPLESDNLTEAVDSMQRLEVLIALEENLSLPFGEEALTADWWAGRELIVDYVTNALATMSRR